MKRTPEQLREIEERLSPSQILSDSTSRQDVEDKQNLLAHIDALQQENDELRARAPKYQVGREVWRFPRRNPPVQSEVLSSTSRRDGVTYELRTIGQEIGGICAHWPEGELLPIEDYPTGTEAYAAYAALARREGEKDG